MGQENVQGGALQYINCQARRSLYGLVAGC